MIERRARLILTIFLLLLAGSIFLHLPGRTEFYQVNLENDEFTIVVLPDTQFYSMTYPRIFENITEWVTDQRKKWNIKLVTHEGDMINIAKDENQWKVARKSMRKLDNLVPYGFCAGNHDTAEGTNLVGKYFPPAYYEKNWGDNWWGGSYGVNNYQLIQTPYLSVLSIHLEFEPSRETLEWAKSVLENHPKRWAIVTTHSFLDKSGKRTRSGRRIWDNLVVPSSNVRLILCGHRHAEARRTDRIGKRVVHQLLANYQTRRRGGNGWIRLLTFSPTEGEIQVRTFSPLLNLFEVDCNSEFDIKFEDSLTKFLG